MKINLKKLTSSAVVAAMLASLGGCAMLDKDDDAVLAVAEDYAEAVAGIDVDGVCDLIADGDDFADELEDYIAAPEEAIEEYEDIVNAIAGTISYEIDEESVESSKKNGSGSVSVTYTIVDYQAVYDQVKDEGGDASDLISALTARGADTTEISQTINLVLDGSSWVVSDKKCKNLYKVWAFYADAEAFEFVPPVPPLADMIEEAYFWGSDNGVYTDESTIELDIIPTEEGQDIEWEFTYEYYLDGDLIFTSDVCTDSGYYIESYYGLGFDDNAPVDDNGHLISGDYRCVVYDLAGNVLADDTCVVTVGDTPSAGSDGDVDTDTWDNGVNPYWYYYNEDGSGDSMATGEYTTSMTTIEFTCEVLDEDALAYFPVYYEVYYSPDGDQLDEVYSATIMPTQYTNGYFYEFQYVEEDGLDEGEYYIVGASDENGTYIYFTEIAEVS